MHGILKTTLCILANIFHQISCKINLHVTLQQNWNLEISFMRQVKGLLTACVLFELTLFFITWNNCKNNFHTFVFTSRSPRSQNYFWMSCWCKDYLLNHFLFILFIYFSKKGFTVNARININLKKIKNKIFSLSCFQIPMTKWQQHFSSALLPKQSHYNSLILVHWWQFCMNLYDLFKPHCSG